MESSFSVGLFLKGFMGKLKAQRGAWQYIKVPILFLTLASFVVLFAGCSTTYYAYSGSGVYQGQGGASKMVDGIELWVVGTPPRKFQIIGYIEDSRPGGPIPMARRNGDMAAVAKRNGGDALLLNADQSQLAAVSSFGNATAFRTGNMVTATGTGMSVPIMRREGRYYVIKYVQELPASQGQAVIPSPKPL